MRRPLTLAVGLLCAALSSAQDASAALFGSVQRGESHHAIEWSGASEPDITPAALRLTRPGQVVRSQVLPLRELHLYEIRATMRRLPGTREQFAIVYTDSQGRERRWRPVWQFPESARVDWLPLSAASEAYVQGFVLPPGARAVHLELRIDAAQPSGLGEFLWELTRLELRENAKVACCNRLGPDRLAGGNLELGEQGGLPIGWTRWGAREDKHIELALLSDPARQHVLRVTAGGHALFASVTEVPVTRGSAWQISMWARGKGHVALFAHPLRGLSPQLVRVGFPQSTEYAIDSRDFRRLTALWFAEAPGIEAAQVAISVTAQTDVEIDSIELRAHER